MNRTRCAAAVLAVVAGGAAAVIATLAPAQAAAPQTTIASLAVVEATSTVSSSGGTRTLVVDPPNNLAATNASIKVQGKGFDTSAGLYVAVCADGSGAPADLTSCVGGAIPNANTTTGWAHITKDGQGTGGVKAAWGADGSFSVTLALPPVTGDVNCVTGKCSLYTTSDADSNRAEDNAVALTFTAPSSSSSPPPPVTPGTAIPQNIGSPTIVAGGTQSVIFSGFQPNEQVNLTLFSAPITLSPATADGTGVAQVQFAVPADFPAGTHRLQAIGQQSGTVGVASFQVTAPPPPPTPTPSPTPTPTPTPTPSSSAASSSSSSSVAPTSAPASSAVSSSSAVAPAGGDSGSSLWWLWLIIAIVVIAGIVTGIVVYRRNQQQQREQDEQNIADAAAREQAAGGPGQGGQPAPYGSDAPTVFLPPVQPGPGGPPPGADPYGLLSGRDHPDNPTLYSGDSAGPTEVLGPQGYQEGPGPYGQPLGYGGPAQGYGPRPGSPGYVAPPEYGGPPPGAAGGPPTQALPPADSGGKDDATGTQAWSPDFDDPDDGRNDGPRGTR